jgi:hypothetical protein
MKKICNTLEEAQPLRGENVVCIIIGNDGGSEEK